jgi:hypothetical protein
MEYNMQLNWTTLIEQLGSTAEQLQHNQEGGVLLLALLAMLGGVILGANLLVARGRRRHD